MRSVGPGRDHRGLSGRLQRLDHALVCVVSLVGDQQVSLHFGQQVVSADQVVRLTSGQVEAERIAESIHEGVDLGAQSAA